MKTNVRKLLKRMGLKYLESKSRNELVLDCVDPACPKPTDHLYLNETTGLWICHRCGVAGNLVVLVAIVRKTTARHAQKLLEEEMPDSLTAHELKEKLKNLDELGTEFTDHMGMKLYAPPPPSKIVSKKNGYPTFLNERNIPFSLALRFGVRVCNSGKYNGRLIFPFKCDGNRSFVAYSAIGQKPKTLNPPGGMNDRMIYQYDQMNKLGKELCGIRSLVVVEGIFDCLRLTTYGYPAIALLGSFLSKNQAILLSDISFDKIIFMLDGEVKIDNYWKQLRNFTYISGKEVLFAPIKEDKKDPDLLSKQEVIELLTNGTIPATESYRRKERISKIIE
jgi:hypothetical protein